MISSFVLLFGELDQVHGSRSYKTSFRYRSEHTQITHDFSPRTAVGRHGLANAVIIILLISNHSYIVLLNS
jgi:hypothetical protein